MLAEPPDPLKRFPLLASSSAEEFADAIVRTYSATKAYALESEGFKGRANHLELQDLKLGFIAMNRPAVIEYAETNDFRQRFILSGGVEATIGEHVFISGANRTLVTSPGQTTRFRLSADMAQLMVMIDPIALERKLTALLGAKPNRQIQVLPSPDPARGYSQHLNDLVFFLAQQLDSTAPEIPPLLLLELQQAIIVAFLSVNQHTFSRQLRETFPSASPREVLRAEQYIEANWSKPIDIEELARVTNVSVRALFRSFRKTRGYSPMAFARMLRLKMVKQMLDEGRPETTVTGAALACGFQNAGHFARLYRETFGELPSTTLARAQFAREE